MPDNNTTARRNKKVCHAELVSASCQSGIRTFFNFLHYSNITKLLKRLGFCFTLRFSEFLWLKPKSSSLSLRHFGIPFGQPTQNPQVQDDEVSDSHGKEIPDKASSAGSVVASSFCLSGMTIGTVALSVLAICIFTITPAFSAFQCTLCPENHYCKSAEKYACPADTPVTATTGAKSEAQCMTCNEKYNNNKTPIFLAGECISCYEYTSQSANPTHTWHNGACTTCAVATEGVQPVYSDTDNACITCEQDNPETPFWDGEKCVSCDAGSYVEFEIPTDNGSFYITKGMPFRIYEYSDTPEEGKVYCVSKAVCDEMNANDEKYPEVTACNYDIANGGDCWAGAVKACRDQGKRLPTAAELAYLAQVVYGDTSIPTKAEYNNQGSLTIANQELFNTLIAGTYYESDKYVYFWSSSSEQRSATLSYKRRFNQSSSYYSDNLRYGSLISAFCLGD